MGDACLVEFLTFAFEPKCFVESDRPGLSMDDHFAVAALPGFLQEEFHQLSADAAFSPLFEHGDSSDSSLRSEPARSNGAVLLTVPGEDMIGLRIQRVDFDFWGNVLFFDKDSVADRG